MISLVLQNKFAFLHRMIFEEIFSESSKFRLRLIFICMKKTPLSTICSVFIDGPGFYKTDGQVNWVKFDKDKYLDTILRNMKISVYILFIY